MTFSFELCIMKLSKTMELVPAVRAISIYRDCRKTLPVVKPGAPPSGRDKSFGFFVLGIQKGGGERDG